jgi:hypothetical protein
MDDVRYEDLDARIHANGQYIEALKIVMFEALWLLHRGGHLRLQEVADRSENFVAYAKVAHD